GGPRLVVNAAEASRVRQIFDLYLELGALLPVVAELDRRGWRNKVWTTRDGRRRGGLSFDKCRVYNLLTNVLYVGKVTHKREVYAGEHEAIVPVDVFQRVRQQLARNGRNGATEGRNRHGALLRGLLYCKACNRVMSHTFTTRGNRRYRYYTCTNAAKRGRAACPTRSLPAAEVERAVVDQIRCIGEDPEVLRDTLAEVRNRADSTIERLAGERREIERALARLHADIRRTAAENGAAVTAPRIAELNERVRDAEVRVAEIDAKLAELREELVDEADVDAAFAVFDNVWEALSPREQARVLRLLIARVDYDADDSSIEVTFLPTGIRSLADGAVDDGKHVEDAA
ncbi:MAG: recombinase zinc beta ribbon domain-containing protein, partial [Planctomycetes bacterium]|nr:recombinase zinc beta ribbon domain-containing protein [Planctomycetota bacterium]